MTATGDLRAAGVSIWLDDLSRERIRSGGLGRLIAERDVVGITTNPTIFANAISTEAAYRTQLDEIRRCGCRCEPDRHVVPRASTADVQAACDILTPVFEATGGLDGSRLGRGESCGRARRRRRRWPRRTGSPEAVDRRTCS
jgi:transaldolase